MSGESEESHALPRVRALGPPQPVPVYNCRVYVRRNDDSTVSARAANLPECTGTGKSEREALAQVVGLFKAALTRHHAAGSPIPFVDPPPLGLGESERLIAVHL